MITRKKRRLIIIVSIIVAVFLIAGIFVFLYLETDMFRSNKTLFVKYLSKEIDNLDEVFMIMDNTDFNEKLANNKYTSQTDFSINYTENIGTTSENTNNSLNTLKLKVSSEIDKEKDYNYQDINLLNEGRSILNAEYIQASNKKGIKIEDIMDKYIISEDYNVMGILKALGYSNSQVEAIAYRIAENNVEGNIDFSSEELEILKNKYINILDKNISKDRFSKNGHQNVSVNGNEINTTAYTLTLTKEEMNNLYLNILEEIKKDEIILEKLEKIEPIISIIKFDEDKPLKEKFVEKIDETIEEINSSNIGQEETSITVYVSKGETVNTIIKTTEKEISIETLLFENSNYIKLNIKDVATEKESYIIFDNKGIETNINLNVNDEDNGFDLELSKVKELNDEKGSKKYNLQYEDETNKIEIDFGQDFDFNKDFNEDFEFDEENSINIKDIDEEQLQQIKNAIGDKSNNLNAIIKKEDVNKILKTARIMNEEQTIESNGISETEKKRFNSKFELLPGKDILGREVLEDIEVIKENFINIEVVSSNQLKFEINQNGNNLRMSEIIVNYLGNNPDKKYDVDLEYDESNGLVKYVILTLKEER